MPHDPIGWALLAFALSTGFVIGRQSGYGRARRESLAGPPPQASPEVLAQARALLASGDKIAAIRLVREATAGMDLKEAREAVEALEQSQVVSTSSP